MSNVVEFGNVVGLDVDVVRREIDFPVRREIARGVDTTLDVPKSELVSACLAGVEQPVGIVPKSRPLIPYAEAMDFTLSQLGKVNIPFKLRKSGYTSKRLALYQEYVFDEGIQSPDGKSLSPMVIMRSSYAGGCPLEFSFGTYRFICSNGALVLQGDQTKLGVWSGKRWGLVRGSGLEREFQEAFNHYSLVSKFYALLYSKPLADIDLNEFFSSGDIAFSYRKQILQSMESEGVLSVSAAVPLEGGIESLKPAMFREGQVDVTAASVSGETLWDTYNRFTAAVSHSDNLLATRGVDRAFTKLVA
jgi:hypothetical protein